MRLCKFDKIRRNHVHSRVTLLEEELLPLTHHAEEVVVHDGNFHVCTLLNGCGQFGGGHLETAIACHRPNFLIFRREPRTDGGGQTKTHRACAAGSDPAIRFVELVILRRPHLVLTHIRGHDRAAAGRLPNIRDEMRHVQLAVFIPVHDAALVRFGLPAVDLGFPILVVVFIHQGDEVAQDGLQITDQWHIGIDVLVQFRRVDLNVDLLRARRIGLKRTGHTVIEAHTEGKDQVRVLDRHIRVDFAMHTHHAEAQFMRGRECAQAKQRARHRRLRLHCKLQ